MKILKWLLLGILGLFLLALLAVGIVQWQMHAAANKRLATLGEEAPRLTQDGISFRDLNKNGTLDDYENPTLDPDARVQDLLGRMTLEEKAGTMFITMVGMTSEGEPQDAMEFSGDPFGLILPLMMGTSAEMLVDRHMNSFNIVNGFDAEVLARHNNLLQKRAERTRLGIPVTIASDPRHVGAFNPGAVISTSSFSQWPGPLGLAALRDSALVQEFGDIARQEYLATGIRLALHPMADLATEPRWARANGTFGEDAGLSAKLTAAYVRGFQGDSLHRQSVACMTKHFSGGGPQKDGEDAHFGYGAEQVYPGDNFAYHLLPFSEGALPARTAQIMPYYGIPVGQTDEDVAFGFNKAVITRLLRDSLGFDGVVCTDWNIITDGALGKGRAWGVEGLSEKERVQKSLEAGCDQFGGEACPQYVVELVREGAVREDRIDVSVARILRDKFILGLFDDPYVEESAATAVAGKEAFRQAGMDAQERSMVLLKNDDLLPLAEGTKLFVVGAQETEAYAAFGEVVDEPAAADVVVYRVNTPYDPRSDEFLESFFHQGRLHFSEEELNTILPVLNQKPAVVIANLERAAILTELDAAATALLAEFGSSDRAVARVLFGAARPEGKLPIELPRTKEAVENQAEDLPYDSENPLYPFGAGISY
ncbi:glycoside hydrolase family 3 N-terminal domain-containing protein [Lewinella sp. W8]|uniref:glycoside hydrolase family 3 protein n=1 Tax=Lewinella sp. W8 TaxID=2528208 RepID=UPI001067E818|nr:glycoside hydrolase family 3 N-terminal domain-containing protein [Lewinella sp. W8]MTB49774.1 glycoside hydrolase family 3 protein [Lewinella sp. W8]